MFPTTTASTLLVVVTTVALVIGGCITFLAHRAARRRESRSLRLFSYGFGVITLGVPAGVVVALGFDWGPRESLLVQGLLVTFGLALLLGSLYAVSSGSAEREAEA